jgi:hypothetical protein
MFQQRAHTPILHPYCALSAQRQLKQYFTTGTEIAFRERGDASGVVNVGGFLGRSYTKYLESNPIFEFCGSTEQQPKPYTLHNLATTFTFRGGEETREMIFFPLEQVMDLSPCGRVAEIIFGKDIRGQVRFPSCMALDLYKMEVSVVYLTDWMQDDKAHGTDREFFSCVTFENVGSLLYCVDGRVADVKVTSLDLATLRTNIYGLLNVAPMFRILPSHYTLFQYAEGNIGLGNLYKSVIEGRDEPEVLFTCLDEARWKLA